MLTKEENEALTRVGDGTPMGRLMRWYWHPIAASTQLDDNPVMPIRLLGENLTLFKDRKGTLGLVADRCAHRRVNLAFGIPEDEGLRCPYHGWLYNNEGQCLEMPAEPADSTFAGRVRITAYPVQELGGLVFAYLGPEPAPLLPRWDLLVIDNVTRDIGLQILPCNWLQIVENDVDPDHLKPLHGRFANYVLERIGRTDLIRRLGDLEGRTGPVGSWEDYEHGVMNVDPIQRPLLFPNINSFSTQLMFRTPVDDEHTLQVYYGAYPMPPGEIAEQESVPHYIIPQSVKDGVPLWSELDNNGGQDVLAWVGQGPIVERNRERLAESDKGVIIFRDLLRRQMKLVEDGGVPMNVFRDAAKNVCVNIPPRNGSGLEWPGPQNIYTRRVGGPFKHSPIARAMTERFFGKEALTGPVV